jgi:uncharacterized spore protein YtfJ
MNEQAVERQRPLMTEIVEGEPIHVGERELVPVVRVTTYARRRAFVGSGRLAGQGWGFVRMQPVAIMERSEAGERCIPIQDKTAQTLSGLLLAALIIPLLLAVAVRLARKS